MTDFMTEQEQIQQLKKWFKEYGLTIVSGILLACAVTFGWNYWQEKTHKELIQASMTYESMLNAKAQGDKNKAILEAKILKKMHPKTSYAQMAGFLLADEAIEDKDYLTAIQELQWVQNISRVKSLQQIARIRIARIFIFENKPQEAINLLTTVDDKNFISMIDEVRGDAFLKMGNASSARQAYKNALKELPNAEIMRPILQMKLDDLASS